MPTLTDVLKDKVAVIYGGAGSLGAGVARAYTDAGARVVLAGRTEDTLRKVSAEVGAEYDVVDALDEAAVEAHADAVVERAGRIDISFSLVPRGDLQGIPSRRCPSTTTRGRSYRASPASSSPREQPPGAWSPRAGE